MIWFVFAKIIEFSYPAPAASHSVAMPFWQPITWAVLYKVYKIAKPTTHHEQGLTKSYLLIRSFRRH